MGREGGREQKQKFEKKRRRDDTIEERKRERREDKERKRRPEKSATDSAHYISLLKVSQHDTISDVNHIAVQVKQYESFFLQDVAEREHFAMCLQIIVVPRR